ncbi:MAG: Copper resistance protein CopC [Acidimicrobiales bacterium]|nr:Copper resistance protein CopC [Acidimicrobiales bacterium]
MRGPGPSTTPRARVRTRALRLLSAAVVLFVVMVAWAAPASAHAVLETSTPADGQTLPAPPRQVSIRFNEDVTTSPRSLRVFDSAGRRVDTGTSRHGATPSSVVSDLEPNLAAGTYLVAWRVISADAHPVHGGFQFNVGHATQVSQHTLDALFANDADRPYQVVGALQRWLSYLLALFAAGATAFLLYAQPDAAETAIRRLIRWTAALAIPATAAAIPIQAALSTGEGFGALTKPGVLGQSTSDGLGLQTLLVIVGALLLLFATRRPIGVVTRWLGWLGAAAAALGFVASGHSRSTDPTALVLAADAAHLAAAAIWFAGLMLVAVVVRRRTEETTAAATRTLARFSGMATASVALVSTAGVFLAWREVRSLSALTSTTYGWLVLTKVALAAAIIAAGAFNHFRLVPVITGDEPNPLDAWRRLLRTVRIEAAGLVVVLGVTAVLVNAVPARTAAGAGRLYTTTVPLVGGTTKGTVNVVVDPTRVGRSELHVYLLDPTGRPTDLGQDVTIELSLPAQGLGPIARRPFKAGVGHYTLLGPTFTVPGRWRVDIPVRISKFELEHASFDVDISR